MTDPSAQKVQENHTVQTWLLFYEDRLLSYAAAREDVLEGTAARPEVSTSGFSASDSTGAKGQRLAAMGDQEPWLRFIQDFERSLATAGSPHLLVILRLRRQYRNHRGRRGWTSPVQVRFPQEMAALTGRPAADHFKVSRNTFQAYWREIVDLAAREALRRGLL